MPAIFPKEIIDNTYEVHEFTHKVRSKIIYNIALFGLLGALLATPFIHLDIYNTSTGILKSAKERHTIISLYGGPIERILVKDNQTVQKNDTLLILNATLLSEKDSLLHQKLDETELFIHDLEYLITHKNVKLDSLKHFKYQKELGQYRQRVSHLNTQVKKTQTDFDRQSLLYSKDVIPKVAFEDSQYQLDLAKGEMAQFRKEQIQYWQATLTQMRQTQNELLSQIKQTETEIDRYIITSPIEGTVHNLLGLDIGSNIIAGNQICHISPDSELIAECYVSPADIGLIKMNNPVKFQITAYDYNQWGMAEGQVIDIGKDLLMIENMPSFKVLCQLNEDALYLKNGTKGTLKKGMTLRARFFVANRSVFQLLYDTVDDWFNPANNQTNG